MSANFVEELVTEYYRIRGYLVLPNYWFPVQNSVHRTQRGEDQKYSARSWKDIDVLAVGEKELILVQVKAIVNEAGVVAKVQSFFDQAEQFIQQGKAPDGIASIQWWGKERTIRKLLVYEYYSVPKYLNQLKGTGIEVREFDSYFKEIIQYIKAKNGVKEESPLMRMIHFLNNNSHLRDTTANPPLKSDPASITR